MKFFKTKRGIIIAVVAVIVSTLLGRHIIAESSVFYKIPYEKINISETLNKENLTEDDYMLIYKHTGVSPSIARETINAGNSDTLGELNNLYFNKPVTGKKYIIFPIVLEDRNQSQVTPFVSLKKGDILITFGSRTLDWRHGHCALVVDSAGTILLEHTSVGNTSSLTDTSYWMKYPSFVVLRYEDEDIAVKAADYAMENLVDIDYSIFAGIFKKDKTNEKDPSSHCSHIVWQAYKACGADIDNNGGFIVTPKDIALSDKLQVVQLYGINPENFTDRLMK